MLTGMSEEKTQKVQLGHMKQYDLTLQGCISHFKTGENYHKPKSLLTDMKVI